MIATSEFTPDFLIIGAAKCATTWLQASLSACPRLYMPAPELHYFSREFDRGSEWYENQFSTAKPGDILGEKSNSYLTDPKAAARIEKACPNVRLVVQLRDPVARAYSDYCMLFRRGEVSDDIARHLDPDRAAAERFLDHGRYAHHLSRFHALFESEQILLMAFEEITQNPSAHLHRLATHIGLTHQLIEPSSEKIKDRTAPMVPRPLRKALAPIRPLVDPVRQSWPIRSLRNLVARSVDYPTLPAQLARDMRRYYRPELKELSKRAPELLTHWSSVEDVQIGSTNSQL